MNTGQWTSDSFNENLNRLCNARFGLHLIFAIVRDMTPGNLKVSE